MTGSRPERVGYDIDPARLSPVARAQQDAKLRVDEGDLQGALNVWARFAEGHYHGLRPSNECLKREQTGD